MESLQTYFHLFVRIHFTLLEYNKSQIFLMSYLRFKIFLPCTDQVSKANLGCLLLMFVDGSMCTFQVGFLLPERFSPKFLYHWRVKSVLIGIRLISFVLMFSVIVTKWPFHEQCKLTLVWIIKRDLGSLYITTVWMASFQWHTMAGFN